MNVLVALLKKPLATGRDQTGGYLVPEEMVRGLRKAESYWRRKDKQKQRRYQHQKRKQ